jgi:hypothetical protein
MTFRCFGRTILSLLVLVAFGYSALAEYPELNDARISAIAQMLPEKPAGFGAPCENRVAWTPVAANYESNMRKAEAFIAQPLPAWDDEAYLDFLRTGKRGAGEAMMQARDGQLSPLVLAECSEWKGRFLPRITEELEAIAAQRSWTLPAHDAQLENFNGKRYFIELNSAGLGHQVAEALYLLGDKIPAATRQRTLAALELHIFAPTRRSLSGVQPDGWLHVHSNWNPVCLNGVTSAALTILPDRKDRALFAAAAEHFSTYYFYSFRDSGYDDEGIGYWGYGFANFAELREQLWFSTMGKLDLYENSKARKAALFGFQFQMLPGVYADYADARFMTIPDQGLLASLDHTFQLHLIKDAAAARAARFGSSLSAAVLAGFPIPSEWKGNSATERENLIGLRTYYEDAGVLVARPAPGGRLAVTIKAGGNAAHSHNDIGSYSIGLASTQPVGDPGGPLFYTAETFTSKRYDSRLLNSFGHPVPEIDGKLQLDATRVKLPPVVASFSPQEDSVQMNLTAAYDDPNLRHFTRTLHYMRKDRGLAVIEDDFETSGAAEIVESFPTHGTCRQIDAKTLVFDYGEAHLQVVIEAPAPFTLTQEKVEEYGQPFNRVGVHLHLAQSARVTMRFGEAKAN